MNNNFIDLFDNILKKRTKMIYLCFQFKNQMFFFTRQSIINDGCYRERMKISILSFLQLLLSIDGNGIV
jgi:hypothetical protein